MFTVVAAEDAGHVGIARVDDAATRNPDEAVIGTVDRQRAAGRAGAHFRAVFNARRRQYEVRVLHIVGQFVFRIGHVARELGLQLRVGEARRRGGAAVRGVWIGVDDRAA